MPSKGEASRQAIVIAARDLFYHRGFAATSYADIGARSGHGKGNVQYHFKSKDDLLAAAVDQRLDGIRQLLEAWTLDCSTPYDCLDRFARMITDNAEDLSHYGCPMGTLNGELGKTEPALQQAARRMFDLFLAWLEARFRGLFPPDEAREKAEFLMVLAQGISALGHSYASPALIHRQTTHMRRWLAEVCGEEARV